MRILENKKHFLHEIVKLELHSEGDFFNLMKEFKIPTLTVADNSDDNSWIAWNKIPGHHVFCCDFEGGDQIISNWLRQSKLATKEFLLTYFETNTEIVKVSVNDFIKNWNSFNFANGFEGSVFISEDGELVMEFTDDFKHNLHSNFSIENKTQSSQTDIFK